MLDRLGIYRTEFRFEDSADARPCVVISPQWYLDERPRSVLVVPLSGQLDLYEADRHFMIASEHEDFDATELGRKCYAMLDYTTFVKRSDLGRAYGCLEGALAQGFLAALAGFLRIP